MRKIVNRLSLFAVSLLATVSFARAADVTLRLVGDVHQPFETMMKANKLRNGMNLVLTESNGEKVWANLKKEGEDSVVEWVITDAAGNRLAASKVNIQNVSPRSEEKWYVCTEPPNGPRVCTEVPCHIVKIPCCKNHLPCCGKL